MESSDKSQDMSKGQLSSITMVNNVSPDTPLVKTNGPVNANAKPPSGFVLPPNYFSRTRKFEFNDKELVTIIEKTSQLYFQVLQLEAGEVEKIPKEEAICKFCFKIFQEDNALKTKCKSNFTLIHESCATECSQKKGNNQCDVCEQDVQKIPVIVTSPTDHHS
ncbi:hypothetical protein CDL12_01859 [Handroanthus impetiginosus]|uniref:Uncharacterized protein n=1 Tax=Handroanthus impetiginosus TaxID=429701 RepID=A0A2G9I6J3_9LAMI|nr:hypothetical protein CDL12_01859 [Handroanthus impetiginosus]